MKFTYIGPVTSQIAASYLDSSRKKLSLKLQTVNVLGDIVLIGSWCKIFYSSFFATDEISILRTSDIDLLIPQNLKTKRNVDIGKEFESLGFSINYE